MHWIDLLRSVDSGSMAYVLSSSTKRSSVTFTQAVYLTGSLLLMFVLTTVCLFKKINDSGAIMKPFGIECLQRGYIL